MREHKASRKPKKREILLILGLQGFGKTLYGRKTVEHRKRSMIYDPVGDFDGLTFDNDPHEMVEYVRDHEIYRVRTSNAQELPVLYALANGVGNCTLVVDESQSVLPPNSDYPETLGKLIFQGRHPEGGPVDLIFIAQRPTTVHIDLRSQATRVVTFAQSDERDVKWVERFTGNKMPELTKFEVFDYYECRRGQPMERKKLDPHQKLPKEESHVNHSL